VSELSIGDLFEWVFIAAALWWLWNAPLIPDELLQK